ncbi:MAG: hypothetical protein U9R25_02475 [Chloroflexota bacterium]|nr:hypothetical protein [Chloroflexota bacterium]
MNQLSERDLHQHVTIVAWLNIISDGFFLLMGCFVFFLLAGIGVAVNESEATPILLVVGLCTGSFMILLALPGIIAGIGLLKRKSWGRILALVVGVFSLINCPIGTIIGGYTLFVLLQESATAYFAGEGPDSAAVTTVSE